MFPKAKCTSRRAWSVRFFDGPTVNLVRFVVPTVMDAAVLRFAKMVFVDRMKCFFAHLSANEAHTIISNLLRPRSRSEHLVRKIGRPLRSMGSAVNPNLKYFNH
jgi:hypothetical protein